MSPTPQAAQARPGSIRLVAASLALAAFAVILYNLHISYIRRERKVETITVYQLTSPVREGQRFKANMVQAKEYPVDFERVFSGRVRDQIALDNVTGKEFTRSVTAGDYLQESMFDPMQLQLRVPPPQPGMRDVAIPVNSRYTSGVLRQDSRVDIEAAFNVGGSIPKVMPVLENVRIKALDNYTVADAADLQRAPRSFRSITIEVTPKEATILSTIKRMVVGEFEIQVRNKDDMNLVKIPEGGINPAVIRLLEQQTGSPVDYR